MRPVEQRLLASLAEEGKPLSWISLVNSVCPWPAVELFDALVGLREAGLIEAFGAAAGECYVINAAGREALAAANPDPTEGTS